MKNALDTITHTITSLRTKFGNSNYLILGILFFGILVMITAVIFFTNTNETAPQNKTETQISQSGTLEVTSRLEGASFTFNNQTYKTPTKITAIKPGSYRLTAQNPGSKNESHTVVIEKAKTVTVSLKIEELPELEAFEEVEASWSEYTEGVAALAKPEHDRRLAENPFIQYLPQAIGNVMLDYDINDSGSLQYVVRPLPNKTYRKVDYEERVNNFIKSKGENPEAFNLEWKF